jgi:predicted PurR-regulated permease PerM
MKNRYLSAFLVVVLIVVLTALPLVFFSNTLIQEVLKVYGSVNQWSLDLDPAISEGIKNLLLELGNSASNFLLSIPGKLVSILVSLFVLFYLFVDGNKLMSSIRDIIPLDEKKTDLLFKEFKQVSYGVAYGLILTGIIIGILSSIGFYIFHVSNPILLGFLTMILVILPVFGSVLVWLPISLFSIAGGDYTNGFGLLIYGLIILTLPETLLKPKLIGSKAKLHPVLVILGVFGGLKIFGFVGIIFGPFILALLITLLKYFINEK